MKKTPIQQSPWFTRMQATVLAAMIMCLSACEPEKYTMCQDGKPHDWGKWEDCWSQQNMNGYMLQQQRCKKCGLVRAEYHK